MRREGKIVPYKLGKNLSVSVIIPSVSLARRNFDLKIFLENKYLYKIETWIV